MAHSVTLSAVPGTANPPTPGENHPTADAAPDTKMPPIGISVRGKFGVRFPYTLPLLRLIRDPLGIDRHRVRNRLGFGRPTEGAPEKRLGFLTFVTHKKKEWGAHNPLVEGSIPSGPTILTKFMALWH